MDPLVATLWFSFGIAVGVVLDRWVLPALVDAWVDRLRRDDR